MINKNKYLPKRTYIQLDDRELSKLKKHRRVMGNDFVIDIVKDSARSFKIFGKIKQEEKTMKKTKAIKDFYKDVKTKPGQMGKVDKNAKAIMKKALK